MSGRRSSPARTHELGQHRCRAENMILHHLFRMPFVAGTQGRDHSGMLLARRMRLVTVVEPDAHVGLYHHMQRRYLVDKLGPPA